MNRFYLDKKYFYLFIIVLSSVFLKFDKTTLIWIDLFLLGFIAINIKIKKTIMVATVHKINRDGKLPICYVEDYKGNQYFNFDYKGIKQGKTIVLIGLDKTLATLSYILAWIFVLGIYFTSK